jgi:hypothetical protein
MINDCLKYCFIYTGAILHCGGGGNAEMLFNGGCRLLNEKGGVTAPP